MLLISDRVATCGARIQLQIGGGRGYRDISTRRVIAARQVSKRAQSSETGTAFEVTRGTKRGYRVGLDEGAPHRSIIDDGALIGGAQVMACVMMMP
jgi:hypothetical protein